MKKLILFSLFFMAIASWSFAQDKHKAGDQGKTYYDAAKTKPKEVYMTKEFTVADPDDPDHPTIYIKKDGPYFYYYENGKLKIEGWYSNDEKSGEWKYYDEKGKLVNTEKYAKGKLVK